MINLNNLSPLPKTWLIDIDGVIFIHNYYLKHKKDKLVPGIKNLFKKLKKDDVVILLTAREKKYRKLTLESLKKYKIRYDYIIFNLPKGERILINDIKPKEGLKTAICVNTKRDNVSKLIIKFKENETQKS